MPVDIVAENQKTATYNFSQIVTSGYGDISVAGFVRKHSMNIGETFEFCIDGPATEIRIIRAGNYGGPGFCEVTRITNTPVTQEELTVIPNTNGATTATHWETTATWEVPMNLTSGRYLAMVRNAADNNVFYISLLVRDDDAEVDIIVKSSDPTWHVAYNYYGTKAQPRGKNLYGIGGVGDIQTRALAGSYHRPVLTRGEVEQTFWWACELPINHFLEGNGHKVKYISSLDLDEQGVDILKKGKILLTTGHDEYWSQKMWDAVIDFRDNFAGKVVTMAANDIFWRVEFERIGDEVIMWCRKDTMSGPVGTGHIAGQPFVPGEWQGTWIDHRWPDRPTDEQIANGVFGMNGVYDYAAVIQWSNHKVWWYSDFHDLGFGTLTLPGIIGFEADHWRQFGSDESNKVLASYTRSAPGGLSDPNGERYDIPGNIEWAIGSRRVKGGGITVDFNTCQWGWILSTLHDRGGGNQVNLSAQQFTINLLHDLGATPQTLMTGLNLGPRNNLDIYGLRPDRSSDKTSVFVDGAAVPVEDAVFVNNEAILV